MVGSDFRNFSKKVSGRGFNSRARMGKDPSLIALFSLKYWRLCANSGVGAVLRTRKLDARQIACAILRLRACGLPCGYATAAASARRNPSDCALRPDTETAFGRRGIARKRRTCRYLSFFRMQRDCSASANFSVPREALVARKRRESANYGGGMRG